MVVYILDSNFDVIDCIEDYISLIWTTRYSKRGDFEIMVKASRENVQKLRKGRYLVREYDINGTYRENVMIVQNVQIQTDVENGDNFIVSGYDLKDIIHRRVIMGQTIFNNSPVRTAIYSLLSNHLISPVDTNRTVSDFVFDLTPSIGSDVYMTSQVTGDNLGDYIEELLEKNGYGYKVYVESGVMYMTLTEGTDRSTEQSINPFVVFSEGFDNLLSTDYSENMNDYANAAYVAGEGEGFERRILPVGNAQGLDRHEIWVDARDISSNEGEISDTEYNNMLTNRGNEYLSEHGITTLFDGNVNNNVNYQYGVDYFLGDIVQVITEYGISLPARITEIIESDDTTGSMMLPTFEYKGGMQ